jgi:hypothetical protein
MPSRRPGVAATPLEKRCSRPGDDLVAADVVMDRAFTLDAPPAAVWPWLAQLGKRRAGWYLPRGVERFVPRGRRAARSIEAGWQQLAAGDAIPDYGGRDATFVVAEVEPPRTLVYRSQRGRTRVSWSLTLTPDHAVGQERTRVHLRLRLGPVRRRWLAGSVGGAVDLATVAGLAAGLRERLAEQAPRAAR